MFFKKMFRALPVIISGILIVTAGVYAWTEPSASPPGGNIAAPINVSGTTQTKTGDLTLPNLYLNAAANEGNIYKANIISGYNDIFIKGNESETSNVYVAGSNLNFYTGGSQRMTIASDGKVGIGTTSPQYSLDVAGVVRVGNLSAPPATAYNGAIYYDTRSDYKKFQCYQDGQWLPCLSSGTAGGVGPGTINYVAKFISTSNIGNSLIFDNGSGVGIGTTAPAAPLNIYSATDPRIIIDAGTGMSPKLYFKSGPGVIMYSSSLGFQDTSLNWDMFINSSGNVGIGTTNPTMPLEVADSGDQQLRLSDGAASLGRLELGYNSTGNYGRLQAWDSTSGAGKIFLNPGGGAININNYLDIGNAGGYNALQSWTSAGAGANFVINPAGGNVGIGTSIPRSTLEVLTSSGLFVSYNSADGPAIARVYSNIGGSVFESVTTSGGLVYPLATLFLVNDGHAELILNRLGGNNDWFEVWGRIRTGGWTHKNRYDGISWNLLTGLHNECVFDANPTGKQIVACAAACNRYCADGCYTVTNVDANRNLTRSSTPALNCNPDNTKGYTTPASAVWPGHGYSGGVMVERIPSAANCLCSP